MIYIIGREIGLDDVQRIKKRMQEIIEEDIPFHRFECQTTEVVELFRKKGMMDKVKLLELRAIFTPFIIR